MIRSLNEDETSPLHGEIKMLGTGRGRVSQAPLAEEIVDFLETVEKVGGGAKIQEVRSHAKRFFLNYVKALSTTFPGAWAGRKYSIKTGAALRAFIRTAPDVMARAREVRRDSVRPQRDPRGDQAVGRAAARPPLRDRGRVEAEARRRYPRDGGHTDPRAARRTSMTRRGTSSPFRRSSHA